MPEEKIINVGVIKDGIIYNSYLISDEKNVLIDSVPKECADALIENILKKLGNRSLDYIIINHTEQDRAGALKKLLDKFPKATVYATIAGLKNIEQQLNASFNQAVAKSNQVLKISQNISLKFLITHNINWPDSMMTYFEEENALFSCDAFSKEHDKNGLKRYFDEKLAYLGAYVYQAMQTLLDIEIETIYPGCGKSETDAKSVIEKYISWSTPSKNDKTRIAVIYESFSKNTENAAKIAYDTLISCDAQTILIDASKVDKEDVLDTIYESDAVMFGTPTMYRNISDNVLNIVTLLNHFEMGEKKFASFGSFGWSGEAPNLIYSYLRARHFETFKTPFRFMFTPTDDEIQEFIKYVKDFYLDVNLAKQKAR